MRRLKNLTGFQRIGVVLSILWTIFSAALLAGDAFHTYERPKDRWGYFKPIYLQRADEWPTTTALPGYGRAIFPLDFDKEQIAAAIKHGKPPTYSLEPDTKSGPWGKYQAASGRSDANDRSMYAYEYVPPEHESVLTWMGALAFILLWLGGIAFYWVSHFTIRWVVKGFRKDS